MQKMWGYGDINQSFLNRRHYERKPFFITSYQIKVDQRNKTWNYREKHKKQVDTMPKYTYK